MPAAAGRADDRVADGDAQHVGSGSKQGIGGPEEPVEAAKAVPWTKPEDVPYDPKGPLPKLGGLFKDGAQIVQLKQDNDLDALRGRPDFGKLLTELEAGK